MKSTNSGNSKNAPSQDGGNKARARSLPGFILCRTIAVVGVALLLAGCGGDEFRNGHAPGDTEILDHATVYHLADGVFIHEQLDGDSHYYLVESSAADYTLLPEGLEVEFGGDGGGAALKSRHPSPYVGAYITRVPGEGPENTRLKLDDETIEAIIQGFNSTTTVQEIYKRRN